MVPISPHGTNLLHSDSLYMVSVRAFSVAPVICNSLYLCLINSTQYKVWSQLPVQNRIWPHISLLIPVPPFPFSPWPTQPTHTDQIGLGFLLSCCDSLLPLPAAQCILPKVTPPVSFFERDGRSWWHRKKDWLASKWTVRKKSHPLVSLTWKMAKETWYTEVEDGETKVSS